MTTIAEDLRPTVHEVPLQLPGHHESPGRRISKRALGYALLVALALVYVVPFAIQIAASLRTDPDAVATRCRWSPTRSASRLGTGCSMAVRATTRSTCSTRSSSP